MQNETFNATNLLKEQKEIHKLKKEEFYTINFANGTLAMIYFTFLFLGAFITFNVLLFFSTSDKIIILACFISNIICIRLFKILFWHSNILSNMKKQANLNLISLDNKEDLCIRANPGYSEEELELLKKFEEKGLVGNGNVYI
jgi:hypothetical protein